MIHVTNKEVFRQARLLQKSLWHTYRRPRGSDDPLVYFQPELAADFLGVQFEHPEDLGLSEGKNGFEVAGLLERRERRIHVAQKFPTAQRLWTGSHEIGHWLCHNQLIHHHDRALEGAEVYRHHLLERQANLFAAEFLMPWKLVKEEFGRRFGSSNHGLVIDDTVAYHLSRPGENLSAKDFELRDRRFRSLRVASTQFFQAGGIVVSLYECFRVSPTAMAIRLEDFGFVT